MWNGLVTKVTQGNTTVVTYTSGQLAAKYGCSPDSIRRYTEQGIANPTRLGKIRIYSEQDDKAIALHRQRLAAKRANSKTVTQEIAAAV